MLPLLGVNLLAFYHEIALPENMAWLGTEPTLIVLSVAFVAETVVHFVPAAGTYLKAMATPLAFVAGTLLMAVPLGDHNPLYQWTLAAAVGGGAATLTHLGVTGARAMTAPANVASLGLFGIFWNIGEFVVSMLARDETKRGAPEPGAGSNFSTPCLGQRIPIARVEKIQGPRGVQNGR